LAKGYLCLALHGHLPYVRHPEAEDHLEERWFYEALTECYIPILKVMEGWVQEDINFRLSLSLSPTLISMFQDPLLQERYQIYLEKMLELSGREMERTKNQPALHGLAVMYRENFKKIYRYINEKKGSLLPAFRSIRETGKLELFTCCGTHPFLPLLKREESVRAHIKTAVEMFSDAFGDPPRGIWLPECGYRQGVEKHLAEFGLKYFFLDAHGILHATPRPKNDVYAPVYAGGPGSGITPAGLSGPSGPASPYGPSGRAAAFGRDPQSTRQVWSMKEGYPGDYSYREYYRDIGFDLREEYLAPYLPAGIRRNTGIKYYRITGPGDSKELYDPQRAREKAEQHAADYMFKREEQVEYLAGEMDRPPVVTAPYDAELFGHWWYEGPRWLDYLVRKLNENPETIEMTDPATYLESYPPDQEVSLHLSSWGQEGYNQVWLNKKNDWVYRHLHQAEERMMEAAEENPQAFGSCQKALKQMARELMLAQASDWTFIITTGTAVEYAESRLKEHLEKFNRLYRMVKENDIDSPWLHQVSREDCLFPGIDYTLYCRRDLSVRKERIEVMKKPGAPRILMLSWEYPPHTVGGLARHVYDLSCALAAQGMNVHVITNHPEGTGQEYQYWNGVHVHRVATYQSESEPRDFSDWAFQLNLVLYEYACRLNKELGGFDLVHAHDWLVAYAASSLKNRCRLPLLTTIHATEHGRNRGIHTPAQRYIHQVEWWLTHESQKVICCSNYMEGEIKTIFNLPRDKIRTIPNGVNPDNLKPEPFSEDWRLKFARPQEKMVLYVGRLVKEKGVDTLVEAIPHIVREYPGVKFVIAGRGPHQGEIMKKARELGIEEYMVFSGFVQDEDRNRLYACSDVAVFPSCYEPFGIVAIEAMAAGTPLVVGDTGGFREIVEHQVDGLKFNPGDVKDLAQCIIRLLKEERLAENLRLSGWQKVVSRYSWDNIARQTGSVYSEIIKKAKSIQAAQLAPLIQGKGVR